MTPPLSGGGGGGLGRVLTSLAARAPAVVAAWRHPAVSRPLFLLLLIHLQREFYRWWCKRRRLAFCRDQLTPCTSDIDTELIQGCLVSTEHFLNLGRVEKRTLFTHPLKDVLGGNEYLVQEVLQAARECRRRSSNCLVTRWLDEDSRYHILQASLNVVSALFGSNYVHFNALDGERTGGFKSTWYCLTITTPMEATQRRQPTQSSTSNTITFTDMSRKPRPTLRIMLVNESELRRIADGKLRPPAWGFFNNRHAERYNSLCDFARNFQMQLVRTPADSKSISQRSPFTSEKVHAVTQQSAEPTKPDGGLMKRVQSQPSLLNKAAFPNLSLQGSPPMPQPPLGRKRNSFNSYQSHELASPISSNSFTAGAGSRFQPGGTGNGFGGDSAKISYAPHQSIEEKNASVVETDGNPSAQVESDGAPEENCFLRVHVPHYIGEPSRDTRKLDKCSALGASQTAVVQTPLPGCQSMPHIARMPSSGDLRA